MNKLEIDEKFEELSNLYDLFENITRIDYVPLEYREEIKKSLIKAYKDGNQEFEKIHEKLKRLEQLEKDYNLLDTTMESDDRIICELLKEKEQLKNDIKLNETQIDDLTLEVANYKHALEEKNEIIMDLKEKNQELKTTLLEYKAQENLYWNTATNNVNLREENEKLKKAIEISKNKIGFLFHIDKDNNYYFSSKYLCNELTQEEYELLKEVLGNE